VPTSSLLGLFPSFTLTISPIEKTAAGYFSASTLQPEASSHRKWKL
jgi:hypothetical protein